MTCVRCREYRTEAENVLCSLCLVAEYEQALQATRRAAKLLPPALRFLVDVAADVGMTGSRAAGLHRAIVGPEPPIPAVFAHLLEEV